MRQIWDDRLILMNLRFFAGFLWLDKKRYNEIGYVSNSRAFV
jgi:hypothetical protein